MHFDEDIQICQLPRESYLLLTLSGFREQLDVGAESSHDDADASLSGVVVREVLAIAPFPLFRLDG